MIPPIIRALFLSVMVKIPISCPPPHPSSLFFLSVVELDYRDTNRIWDRFSARCQCHQLLHLPLGLFPSNHPTIWSIPLHHFWCHWHFWWCWCRLWNDVVCCSASSLILLNSMRYAIYVPTETVQWAAMSSEMLRNDRKKNTLTKTEAWH